MTIARTYSKDRSEDT